ncbi:MAG: hypothetical protein VZR95_00640 [Alphaproteobacteria bacterium]
MPLNSCFENICNLLSNSKKEEPRHLFRITVVAFEDKCNINCGLRFAELLKRNTMFDVQFFNEPFPKGFLNLQGRNFFDFIDRGNKILKNMHSDILIWGYEENGKIRLNFQINEQYVIPNTLTFSLLDSLFVPLSFFANIENFSKSLLLLIYGIIIAAVNPITNDQIKYQPILLKDIISLLSEDTSPKDMSREFMPYIMNMLGKIYLCDAKDNLNDRNIEIIENLFETALKDIQFMRFPIYYGCVFNNLGQLFETVSQTGQPDSFSFLKRAIKHYQEAQKYLNKNYPYDYGLISYRLARLYFEYWKHTNDLQALRDAVSQLREAEKVYSAEQFPQSWCHVEGLLGYYLASLGMTTKSNEVMQLAVNSYKQQQQMWQQYTYPVEWAKIQEEIGNIYYTLGKQNDDDNFMFEARNYFNSALNVYEELKLKNEIKQTEQRLAKIKNYVD